MLFLIKLSRRRFQNHSCLLLPSILFIVTYTKRVSQSAYPRRTVNFIKIQNQLQPAFGVGFGKCSHVKVDRAILHYKGLFTRIILVKSAFNYCQGTPKYENFGTSQTIAL